MQTSLFPDAIVADWSFLNELTSRQLCPSCMKSRKYFCYSCNIALPDFQEKLPKVKLPVKVDIIKHPSEMDGKSTSAQAAILAPDDVTIHIYPRIPDYENEKVVLVFPGKDAVTLSDFLTRSLNLPQDVKDSVESSTSPNDSTSSNQKNNSESENVSNSNMSHISSESRTCNSTEIVKTTRIESDKALGTDRQDLNNKREIVYSKKRSHSHSTDSLSQLPSLDENERPEKIMKISKMQLPFDRVIFIDSTWNQTSNIVNDERLKDFQKVEIKSRQSNFWRKQQGIPKSYLCTIEAIYYFLKDLHTFLNCSYQNEYDNLLFLFCFMHSKIVASENNASKS